MEGLKIEFSGGFYNLVTPALPLVESYYWLLDTQINCPDFVADPQKYWDLLVDTRLTSRPKFPFPLFRPELLGRYGRYMIGGEWSLFLGIPAATDDEAALAGLELGEFKLYDRGWFACIAKHAVFMVLLIAGGRWEVYTANEEILRKLTENFTFTYCDALEDGIGSW